MLLEFITETFRRDKRVECTLGSFPFKFSTNQVLFVESVYNREINDQISNNLSMIKELFSRNSLEFIYPPEIFNNGMLDIILNHFRPHSDSIPISEQNITSIVTNRLFTTINYKGEIYPSLCFFKEEIKKSFFILKDILTYDINGSKISDFITKKAINTFDTIKINDDIKNYSFNKFYNSLPDPILYESNLYIDNFSFKAEVVDKVTLLKRTIAELTSAGYYTLVVDIIKSALPIRLSKMKITKDNRIVLEDYNNFEIQLSPLPKALYLLFLRHPEGIRIKDLPSHLDELYCIYSILTNREDEKVAKVSVENLTDPHSNSINEKISRIKEAFEFFTEDISKNYIITGKRGGERQIIIDRKLVSWDSSALNSRLKPL